MSASVRVIASLSGWSLFAFVLYTAFLALWFPLGLESIRWTCGFHVVVKCFSFHFYVLKVSFFGDEFHCGVFSHSGFIDVPFFTSSHVWFRFGRLFSFRCIDVLFHIHPCVLFPILYFRIFLECLPVASSCILSFVVDFILCLTLSWDLMITLELEGVNLLTVLPTVRERDCILFTILPIVRERRLTCLQFYRLEEKWIPKKKLCPV